MTQTRTSRTLAATAVTAALVCALPAVGHAGSCDRLRDGQAIIDWARAQGAHSGQTQSARPARRPQSLESLLGIGATGGK